MSELPKVSVVVPTYGRAEAVKVAIETVKAQSLDSWELLIVDDNPPESDARAATRELVKAFVSDKIKYIELARNSGACIARNTGVEHASANYIAFLDDDDNWHTDKLQKCLDCFQSDKQLDLLIHNIVQFYNHKNTRFDFDLAGQSFFDFFIAKGMGVSCSAIVVDKESFLKVGGFDPELQSYQDLDLMLRLAKNGKAQVLREDLLYYMLGDDGITFNFRRKIAGATRLLSKFADEFKTPAGKRGFKILSEALGDYHMMQGNATDAQQAYQQTWQDQPSFKGKVKMCLAKFKLISTFKTLLTIKKKVLLKLNA